MLFLVADFTFELADFLFKGGDFVFGRLSDAVSNIDSSVVFLDFVGAFSFLLFVKLVRCELLSTQVLSNFSQ